MQIVIKPKSFKAESSPALKTRVVLDLGNGQVKALLLAPGAKRWERVSFPSYAAETERSDSSCVKIYTPDGFKNYLVGEDAAAIPMSHTGKSEAGKSENARLLLIHALRLAFGDDAAAIHCEVIFTSPSNKAYGSDISAQLQNVHPVTIPADAEVIGSEAKSFTVTVHRAVPQLEGHYAFTSLNLKKDSWIVDCGNRTMIATKVKPNGAIIKRSYFGGCGVRGIAESITANESLTAHFQEHTPERVIDFLFENDGADIEAAIAPDVQRATGKAIAFLDDAPRYLIGGGADVPGLAELIGATVPKNSQWVNIQALADISAQILGDA